MSWRGQDERPLGRTFAMLSDMKVTTAKVKHVRASNIWSFVNGKGELTFEEHRHLKQCRHCDAIFKYFAIYPEPARLDPILEEAKQAA
jgi:hypothetical protein